MKAINFKLATFSFAALLLASCSDSNDINGGGNSGTNTKSIVGKEVVSVTDAQELASRVINYKNVVTGTRAAGATSSNLSDVYSMPAQPSNEGAEEITNENGCQNLANGKTYIIKKGVNVNSNINLNGATLIVEGTLNTTNLWNNSTWDSTIGANIHSKLIVLEGGTLNINHTNTNLTLNSGLYIYNYGGNVIFPSSFKEIQTNEGYFTSSNLKLENDLYVQGALYVGGNLEPGSFNTGNGAKVNVQGTLSLPNQDVQLDGTVNFGGKFTAKNISAINSCNLYACSIEAKEKFSINSNNAKAHISYLKAKNIYQCAGSYLYLVNNSVIECTDTYENENNGTGTILLEGDNAKAYFKAGTIKYNGSNDYDLGDNKKFSTCYIFNANGTNSHIYLGIGSVVNNAVTLTSYNDVPWGGNTKDWNGSDTNLELKSAECGYNIIDKDTDKGGGDDDKTTKKDLDVITDIDYDHTHDISATCIQPYNGKMYMSYHTRGLGHGACIEVFQTASDKTTLLQYLQEKEGVLDFNHLMVDSKASTPQVYVVGNSNKTGAILARIDLTSGGLLNTDVKEIDENTTIYPLTVVPMIKDVQTGSADAKHDENCIVRDGDKLLVMSTRGYEVYNPNTLESLGNKEQPGKAKHISLVNNDIATIYYTDRSQDSLVALTGKVELFNAGDDILTATPKKSFEVGDIAPNHGKNTIAIDGNYLYVCRSAKGLSCFDLTSGTEVWNWGAPLTANTKVPQGYANGVTYDDNYIYLACGGYGLVVLDKNNKAADGKPVVVAKKRCDTKNSANYVTLDGGYIYVAYGKSRLQVFKLVDKVVSSKDTDM